jgi:hypothetical protein
VERRAAHARTPAVPALVAAAGNPIATSAVPRGHRAPQVTGLTRPDRRQPPL